MFEEDIEIGWLWSSIWQDDECSQPDGSDDGLVQTPVIKRQIRRARYWAEDRSPAWEGIYQIAPEKSKGRGQKTIERQDKVQEDRPWKICGHHRQRVSAGPKSKLAIRIEKWKTWRWKTPDFEHDGPGRQQISGFDKAIQWNFEIFHENWKSNTPDQNQEYLAEELKYRTDEICDAFVVGAESGVEVRGFGRSWATKCSILEAQWDNRKIAVA